MAYYCRKCHRWHSSGAIARSHKIFSVRPPRSGFRPKTAIRKFKPRQTRRRPKKIKKIAPILTITHKKKEKKARVPKRPAKLRKASIGLSRMRRGQLRMKPEDTYENKMVKKLRRTTGMTHVQVMNLVHLAKKSDYLDVETEIAEAAGHSREKSEVYEFAKKRIMQKLQRSGDVMVESKYSDESYWDEMQQDWKRQQEWEKINAKWRKKCNLI